jgi:hypothetical protein
MADGADLSIQIKGNTALPEISQSTGKAAQKAIKNSTSVLVKR